MRVLVIGSGAREHAVVARLAADRDVGELVCVKLPLKAGGLVMRLNFMSFKSITHTLLSLVAECPPPANMKAPREPQ